MKQKIILILFSLLSVAAFATHERAGEITYKHIAGFTYEISATTYTKGTSTQADRCTITIRFSNIPGDSAEVCRSNFETSLLDPTQDYWGANGCNGTNPYCTTHHMGEWLIGNPPLWTLDIKKNVYTIQHTYNGPGVYIISMTDPNRNGGIVNVPDLTPFSVQDTLTILQVPGMPDFNNSVILTNMPIDKACVGECFVHNPGAIDPDGDSLSYKLGTCFEDVGTPVQSYFLPYKIQVNPYTGDFTWCNLAPQFLPPPYQIPYEYNFAMDIEEWKLNTINKKRYLVGTVRRDMQVKVYKCNNDPPVISDVKDTCIPANTVLTLTVTATDTIQNDGIQYFTASGDPFNSVPAATFTTSFIPPQTPVSGVFSWAPTCNQVRLQPYLVTFKALDDGAPGPPIISLTDFETFFIRVIAPAPKNLTAHPECTTMHLQWDAAFCNPASNPLIKYTIYRKIGCDTLKPGYCETGIPASWSYLPVGSVSNTITTFTDNNGLVHGNMYSYRVVAIYLDGSQSYVSDPICAKLVRDVPIITNVDVATTGLSGSMNVKWLKPIADPANYDTTLNTNKGPYKF
jgi:hypothetical protein